MNLRVVKIGGSLLDWPELATALRQWLDSQPARPTVLVAGGGARVEELRNAAEFQALPDAPLHWIAIGMMSSTARQLQMLLQLGPPATDVEEVQRRMPAEPLLVLDAWNLLVTDEREGRESVRLPQDWSVSADSIAARVAIALNAAELVLLKSCLPAGCLSWQDASSAGYVDPHFPEMTEYATEIRCVNLREVGFAEWKPAPAARLNEIGKSV